MAALYSEQLNRHLHCIETMIPVYLPKTEGSDDAVVHAMSYACEGGGKRLRPVLLLEFCRLCCGKVEPALPFAAAIEMIHSYSLIHDDLPCMDNSALRRGKPSTHAMYGETMALLAGDALLNRAFEVMLDSGNLDPMVSPDKALRAAFVLAHASGIYGMVGGQSLDLRSEGQAIDLETLKQLQDGKTAALLIAACKMGCLVGGGTAEQVAEAERFGRCIGLAFQIVDDILDVTATEQQLGKPVGSDSANEKVTYVTLLGLEKARQLAENHTNEAKEALSAFPSEREELYRLADALLQRVS